MLYYRNKFKLRHGARTTGNGAHLRPVHGRTLRKFKKILLASAFLF